MKQTIEWIRWFPHDHWRLYGCIRLLVLLAAETCLVVALDKITVWLLECGELRRLLPGFRGRTDYAGRMGGLYYGETEQRQSMIDGIPNWFTIPVGILAWIGAAAAMCWVLRELGLFPHDEPPDED